MRLSVVVPALNEASGIGRALERARVPGVHELIVVDGGSTDGTPEIARPYADRVLFSRRGRAEQMNVGASAATGDVLLFLHADTLLPPGFAEAIQRALRDPGVAGGRFDVDLQPSTPLLWLTATLINVRSRLSRISTGDQAIFVRRRVFEAIGGFPRLPLMEDVAFSRQLKRAGKVACLREKAITSSRRWLADGVLRTILLMWTLRFLFFAGVSAERLCRLYPDRR